MLHKPSLTQTLHKNPFIDVNSLLNKLCKSFNKQLSSRTPLYGTFHLANVAIQFTPLKRSKTLGERNSPPLQKKGVYIILGEGVTIDTNAHDPLNKREL